MAKVKFSEVKAGDFIKADGGFTCLDAGEVCKVYADDGLQSNPHVPCREGKHFLCGQIGTDGVLVGFTAVQS